MSNLSLLDLEKAIKKSANPAKAEFLSRFFKTGKDEYAEGDVFLGLTVPQQRQIAKKYQHLNLKTLSSLIKSRIHEYRLIALLILVFQYQQAEKIDQQKIVDFYLKNTKRINNWDLVDLSAPKILGPYFLNQDKKVLYQMARSENLWQRRIAVLTTFEFIRHHQFQDSLKIAAILLKDQHDLIHKAVGWMLREVGKHDSLLLEDFLKKHTSKMPRTMLRYAIEKFSPNKRQFYLKKKT